MGSHEHPDEPPATPLRVLDAPPDCADPRATEMLRAWIVAGQLHSVIRTDGDLDAWAAALVGVLRHVAIAYEQDADIPFAETLSLLRGSFDGHAGGIGDPSHTTAVGPGNGPLPHPGAAEASSDYTEILRIWETDSSEVSLRYDVFGQPTPWGHVVADLLVHLAVAHDDDSGAILPRAAELRRAFLEAWTTADPTMSGRVFEGRPQPSWRLYLCVSGPDDAPTAVRIDISPGDRRPEPELPLRADLWIPVNDPDRNGYPSPDEADRLGELEDAFAAAVEQAGGAVLLVVTSAGRRCCTAQLPADARIEPAVALIQGAHPSHELDLDVVDDPQWTRYEAYWPNQLAWGFIHDGEVLETLARHGDDGRTERDIEHFAYFRDAAARDAFLERLADLTVTDVTRDDDGPDARRCTLRFVTHLAPRGRIQALCERLRIEAARADGAYDGWESPVVRSDA